MKFQCLNDRVLVEHILEDEVSAGGILIPVQAREKPQTARVIAVGEGGYLANGAFRKTQLKVGDVILTGKYSGSEIKIDGHDYVILMEEDVFGKMSDDAVSKSE